MTGFIVNMDRTKMLLHFHERLDQWQPVGGWAESQQCLRQQILERVTEAMGVTARHVTSGELRGGETKFVLEAEEFAVSAIELEEQYNAQWLNRKQILSCACMHEAAREFATGYLKTA